MSRFVSVWKIGVVVAALLVTVMGCGNSESSRARNATLIAGTACSQPGQVTKISDVPVVCAQTDTGKMWYLTMKAKGRAVLCAKPGVVRKKKAVVWVCGVTKNQKLWRATAPLSVAVLQATAVAEPGVVELAPVLESTDVATPSRPVVADNNVLANPAIADEPPVTTPVTITTVPETIIPTTTIPRTTTTLSLTCATGGTCNLRDIGPGGGIVFYVASTPFDCGQNSNASPFSQCTYLEAAIENGTTPSSWTPDTKTQWGCYRIFVSGTGLEIGAGRANTKLITENKCMGTDGSPSAASVAMAYNGGNKTDWFLPSRKELDALCNEFFTGRSGTKYSNDTCVGADNTNPVNGTSGGTPWRFASDKYWSSSVNSAGGAWSQYFTNGTQGANNKTYPIFVRPVRAF